MKGIVFGLLITFFLAIVWNAMVGIETAINNAEIYANVVKATAALFGIFVAERLGGII